MIKQQRKNKGGETELKLAAVIAPMGPLRGIFEEAVVLSTDFADCTD
jgi:hypothetical protein